MPVVSREVVQGPFARRRMSSLALRPHGQLQGIHTSVAEFGAGLLQQCLVDNGHVESNMMPREYGRAAPFYKRLDGQVRRLLPGLCAGNNAMNGNIFLLWGLFLFQVNFNTIGNDYRILVHLHPSDGEDFVFGRIQTGGFCIKNRKSYFL